MPARIGDPVAREVAIVERARRVAEAEGWPAVTTRRLAQEIGFSQPVIYGHFSSMQGVMDAVALQGFSEMADELRRARGRRRSPRSFLAAMSRTYLRFAEDNPAVFEAMFSSAGLTFASASTPEPLTRAFAELRTALETVANGRDTDVLAEVWWSALHGQALLARDGRLPERSRRRRIETTVDLLLG